MVPPFIHFMKRISITLLFALMAYIHLFAQTITINITNGSEYNSYNNVNTDYSGKTLTIYANNNGKAYLEFSVKENSETTNVVTNGSSRRRETTKYIKRVNNSIFRAKLVKLGNPYFYYVIVSNSRYDDRQSLFCVGCFIHSDNYYFIIKKNTYQNGNVDSPIFETSIVSIIDYSTASQIAEVLNRYIPQIAIPDK